MHSLPRFPAILRPLLLLLCFSGMASRLHAQAPSRTVIVQLTANPDPSYYESNIDIIAFISVPNGGVAPGGSVILSVDGVVLGPPLAVQNNIAEYFINTPTYSTGKHTVTAIYSGDANYDAVTVSVPHTTSKLRSQMALNVKTPTIFYGQTADAVGQVLPIDNAPDANLNGGTITFLLDGNEICVIQVTGRQTTCPDSAGQGIEAGAHILTATYSGNEYYEASQSPDGNITVLPDDTRMTLSTSLTPSLYGQPVTFSAPVTAPYATPVGPVNFYDGVTPIGTGNLDATGTASVTTSTLTLGTHSILAKYPATRNFNASNATAITQVVVLPPPTPLGTVTLLTSSLNPSVVGQNVTFTATVATTGAFVQIPTGTVTFLDGTTPLGTAKLDSSGTAQFSTAALTLGDHKITVSYPGTQIAGTQILASNTSAVLVQQVVASLTTAGNGFLLTVTPPTFGVGVGNYVSVSVNVLPLNGFNEPVTLSCASAPAEMRCLFDEVTIPKGGGTTRLTINPAAPHDCGSNAPYFISAGKAGFVLPWLVGFGSLLLRRRRRMAVKYLALMALLSLLPLLGGCGHCTDLGVKPGTYTFSVQGASTGSSAVTHAVVMKMNVHL